MRGGFANVIVEISAKYDLRSLEMGLLKVADVSKTHSILILPGKGLAVYR